MTQSREELHLAVTLACRSMMAMIPTAELVRRLLPLQVGLFRSAATRLHDRLRMARHIGAFDEMPGLLAEVKALEQRFIDLVTPASTTT